MTMGACRIKEFPDGGFVSEGAPNKAVLMALVSQGLKYLGNGEWELPQGASMDMDRVERHSEWMWSQGAVRRNPLAGQANFWIIAMPDGVKYVIQDYGEAKFEPDEAEPPPPRSAAPRMTITEILSPDMLVPELRGTTKSEVLAELADAFCKQHPEIQLDRLIELLHERERQGSTAWFGDGIATPRTPIGARTGVNRLGVVFARSTQGVDFESLNGNPTHLFYLLVDSDSGSLRYRVSARLEWLLRDPSFCERLLKAADAAELYALLKQEDEKYT